MGRNLLNIYKWLNERAGWVLGIGILGLCLSTYRQWKRLSKQRDKPSEEVLPLLPTLAEYPLVSLLIPAWNESRFIAQCLNSALGLRYPNKEIIVCAGGLDGTYYVATTFEPQGVIVLEQTLGMGKQKALQQCFENSNGEIIYLTDADCLLEDASFEAIITPIISGQESVTTGYFEPFPAARSNWLVEYQWRHHANWQNNLPLYVQTLDGANSVIKKDVLQSIGGFTVNAPIGTDYVLSKLIISKGYCIRSIRTSRVQTHYPVNIPEYLHQLSRWFRNRLVLGIRFHSWDDVFTSIRAGGSAGVIISMPLLCWLRSPFYFSLWALLSFRAVVQNWLVLTTHRSKGELVLSSNVLKMALLGTPVNLLGMARGLLESLLYGYNQKW